MRVFTMHGGLGAPVADTLAPQHDRCYAREQAFRAALELAGMDTTSTALAWASQLSGKCRSAHSLFGKAFSKRTTMNQMPETILRRLLECWEQASDRPPPYQDGDTELLAWMVSVGLPSRRPFDTRTILAHTCKSVNIFLLFGPWSAERASQMGPRICRVVVPHVLFPARRFRLFQKTACWVQRVTTCFFSTCRKG